VLRIHFDRNENLFLKIKMIEKRVCKLGSVKKYGTIFKNCMTCILVASGKKSDGHIKMAHRLIVFKNAALYAYVSLAFSPEAIIYRIYNYHPKTQLLFFLQKMWPPFYWNKPWIAVRNLLQDFLFRQKKSCQNFRQIANSSCH
jgi:hypothetical protein